jgi:hypothetical protein
MHVIKSNSFITNALQFTLTLLHAVIVMMVLAMGSARISLPAFRREVLQAWRFDLISWADAPRPIDFRTVQVAPV